MASFDFFFALAGILIPFYAATNSPAVALSDGGISPATVIFGSFFALLVIGAGHSLGLYRVVTRYFGLPALGSILVAAGSAAGLLWAAAALSPLNLFSDPPFDLATAALAVLCTAVPMALGRLCVKEISTLLQGAQRPNVVVFGAGSAGWQLLVSVLQSAAYRVVALVDDAPHLHGREIYGVRVYAPCELLMLKERFAPELVILAAQSISRQRKGEILALLESTNIPLRTLPSVIDIVSGKRSVSDLQAIDIEDVLGRDPVEADQSLLFSTVQGRAVMVTGGGGSIGRELCLQIAKLGPSKLVVFDSSEVALYSVMTELGDRHSAPDTVPTNGSDQAALPARPEPASKPELVAVLQSVLDEKALLECMQQNKVQTVFHAAAFKHVPLVEANPFAGLQNNVFGTLATLRASQAAGVRDFVLISTDKAVRPTNIMGASKRLAELCAQALAAGQHGMCVSMVRFGNVLSSSGSVIPRFKDQIAAGGPVTVTHPEITRYFMTIPEAVQLVLQAGGLAKGGELFLLEMGEPVRIVDLAQRMVRLTGHRPVLVTGEGGTGQGRAKGGHDIEIHFTGLRPGEKLYEELLVSGDAQPSAHPKIFQATERYVPWDTLQKSLAELQQAIEAKDITQVHKVLRDLQVDYSGEGEPTGSSSPARATWPRRAAIERGGTLGESRSPACDEGSTHADANIDTHIHQTSSVPKAPETDAKTISPFLSKLLHGYFLLKRPTTLGVRAVVVNDKEEVMLVRHRYEPGWQLPGGGVENGETAIEALRRELQEEARVQIKGVTKLLGSFFNQQVSRRDYVLVYLVEEFDLVREIEASHEIAERGFFPLHDLPEETTAGTRRRLAECFQGRPVAEVW